MENAGEHIEALRDMWATKTLLPVYADIIADLGLPIDLTDLMKGKATPKTWTPWISPRTQNRLARKTWCWTRIPPAKRTVTATPHGGDGCSRRHGRSRVESDPDEALPMPDDAGRIPVDNNYKAYSERFDEIIRAEEL